MYPVSEAYKNAIARNERNVRIIGTITLKDGTVIEISDEDIVQGSLYVSEQCVAGEDIEIGNVYASEMGLSLNSPPENPYALDGARIVLNFGIETSDDVWEYVPLGYFYVTEIERKTNAVALKALDGMILFDTDLSGVLTTGTPYEMISSCCSKVGITLATNSATFSTFANGNMTFTLPADSKVQTCRDLIMWLCQLTGTFARMNRMGQLEIVPVKGGTSVKTIDRQQRFTSDVSDSYVKITKVAMKVGDVEYSQGTDGMTMALEENPFLVGKSEAEINAILGNILNQVTTAEYVPYNVNFAGDPALQAGDYINLTGIKVFDKIRATFTRSSVAYLSDGTQVAANQPRFEPGKFGKAVMVEEGTTNLIKNPCASSDLTYWYLNKNANSVASMTRITNDGVFGSTCVECTRTTLVSPGWIVFQQMLYQYLSSPYFDTTKQYTLSFWARSVAGSNVLGVAIKDSDGTNTVLNNTTVILTSSWQRYVITFTPLISGNRPVLYLSVGGDNTTFRITAVQLEAKPYATSFIDGTRAAETLTIPTAGVLNPQEGTIEFWWNPLAKTPQTYPSLISTGQWTNPITQDWLAIHWGSGWSNANTVTFAMYNKNGTSNFNMSVTLNPQPYTWYYVTAKWSFVTRIAKLIIFRPDGTYVSTQATINGEPPTFEGWDKFYILQTWNNGIARANSLIDDLRISNKARTDAEIAAAYASGQPLPVDEWTTLKMNFDGSLSTITTAGDSIVTHSNWRYRGPHNIKAVGKSALVRGVQAQQTKSVSAVKTVAEAAREIAQAANQSTQLIQDAITGYVLIRKNETTGSNEILIMDNPDPAQARKVWRWNMGGLGYSDNVVGVDNPNRQYTIAITMDGAINADFIKTGTLIADRIRGGTLSLGGNANVNGVLSIKDATGTEVVRGDSNGLTVQSGSYFIVDAGMNTTLVQKPNLIPDHSFEALIPTGAPDATYKDFAFNTTGNSYDWNKVGAPRLLVARSTDVPPEAAFGLQCVATDNSNYVYTYVRVKPNTTYYVSGFTARGYRPAGTGYPRIFVRYVDVDGITLGTEAYNFTAEATSFKWKRVGFSFTTPTNTEHVQLVFYSSASGSWYYWDGVQLVEGNVPTRYDPEENLWRYIGGYAGLSYSAKWYSCYYGYISTNTSLPAATWTVIPYGPTGSGNGTFTAPAGGMYFVQGSVFITQVAANAHVGVVLYVNGTPEKRLFYDNISVSISAAWAANYGAALYLSGGDSVNVRIYCSQPATFVGDTTGVQNWMEVYKI